LLSSDRVDADARIQRNRNDAMVYSTLFVARSLACGVDGT